MKCLIYAFKKYKKEGGYISIRKCTNVSWLPHFIHAKGLTGVSHMTAGQKDKNIFKSLWNILTGKNYVLKESD